MDFFQEIPTLVKHLNAGGVILYPTDTIWGLGCDATNIEAIERLNDIKKRKPSKSYILLVDSHETLKKYVDYIPPKARNLIEFHKRPLTIIYQKPKNLPAALLAEDGSVGIRVTQDAFCQSLIKAFGKPIVSTSANTSGEPYPVNFADIDKKIIKSVEVVAQYKQNAKLEAKPSAVVKVIDEEPLQFIRK